MADKTRLVLNLKGINAIMTSAGVQAELDRRAERIAAAAGDGFEVSHAKPHPWVARVYVRAATPEAMREEATNKSLTRAIDAGRG